MGTKQEMKAIDLTQGPVNLAAIDIGSNGARLLIKKFDDNAPEEERIQKVMFIRVPLRLGKDVFALEGTRAHDAPHAQGLQAVHEAQPRGALSRLRHFCHA